MNRSALILFAFGVFLMLIHTTIAAVWTVLGLPGAPPLTAPSGVLYYLQGFSPPLGVLLLFGAGLLNEAKAKDRD